MKTMPHNKKKKEADFPFMCTCSTKTQYIAEVEDSFPSI